MAPHLSSAEEITKVKKKPKVKTAVETTHPWRLILYNDDIHTFDEVINQLIKALGCSKNRAEELTLEVHTHGKAVVFKGSFEECFEKNSILAEIQLITEIKG